MIVTHNLQQAYRIADHVGVHVPRRARRVRDRAGDLRLTPRAADEGVRQWRVRLGVQSGPRASAARWWRLGLRWRVAQRRSRKPLRLRLNSARIRVSQHPTKVAVAGRALRVTHVALVRGRTGSAIVVRLHNPGARTVSDLPISVGLRKGAARQRPLNVKSPEEFSYFDAHVPVIAPGATVTWVYTTTRHLPAGARPYAIVGARPSVRAPRVSTAPVIVAIASGDGHDCSRRGHAAQPILDPAVPVAGLRGCPSRPVATWPPAR